MIVQENTYETELTDDLRKLEVGRALVFVGWDTGEIPGPDLAVGTILCPVTRNACGMGIDVAPEDGTIHMVWSTEVEVLP